MKGEWEDLGPSEESGYLEGNAVKWRVTYHGPALDTHEMDVRELAPALIAIADIFDYIGEEMLGGRGSVQVRVRGSFQTGSFAVDLLLVQKLATQLMNFLTSKPMQSTEALTSLVNLFYEFIRFFRHRRGREVLRFERRKNQYIAVFKDGTEIEVEETIVRLLQNQAAIDALRRAAAPLEREGIELVAFGTDRDVQEMINKDDASYIVPIDTPEEILIDEERKLALSLLSVVFKEDNKWRMSDGKTPLFVAMEDPAFLERMDKGEAFAKGDLLIGRVRIRQVQRDNRLHTGYSMVEVLEHRHSPEQTLFPFDSTESNKDS